MSQRLWWISSIFSVSVCLISSCGSDATAPVPCSNSDCPPQTITAPPTNTVANEPPSVWWELHVTDSKTQESIASAEVCVISEQEVCEQVNAQGRWILSELADKSQRHLRITAEGYFSQYMSLQAGNKNAILSAELISTADYDEHFLTHLGSPDPLKGHIIMIARSLASSGGVESTYGTPNRNSSDPNPSNDSNIGLRSNVRSLIPAGNITYQLEESSSQPTYLHMAQGCEGMKHHIEIPNPSRVSTDSCSGKAVIVNLEPGKYSIQTTRVQDNTVCIPANPFPIDSTDGDTAPKATLTVEAESISAITFYCNPTDVNDPI